MKKYFRIIGNILVLVVFFIAVWLIYNKLRMYSLSEIKEAVIQISSKHLCYAFFFMVLNYVVLIGYDWLALKAIQKKISLPRVSLVSFIGSVTSLNFGALLGGSTVRYRFYSLWGFEPIEIVRLILMLAVTFWIGAMGLAGALFIIEGDKLPSEFGFEFISVRMLGFILLGICILYHIICWKAKGRVIYVFGKAFALPPVRIAILQTITSGVDLIIAAACLYSLLPHHSNLSFYEFLPSYLLAQVAVVLTHVPGGVGILELVIINMTDFISADIVFAAVLVFRVIYYIIPLIVSSLIFLGHAIFVSRCDKSEDRDACLEK